MLEVNNLCLSFNRTVVLENLNVKINNGTIYGILGKNGAGKTSFFDCLFQTYKYTGEIFLNHQHINRKDIAYLETENYFYPYITGKEYLGYFSKKKNNYEYLIEEFKIPMNKYIHNYSTGMKKKIALIAHLSLDKPVLVLDEPFNGLDFEGVMELYRIIKNLQNKIVLLSSHIIETLFNTCDKIGVLSDKKVKQEFLPSEYELLKNYKF